MDNLSVEVEERDGVGPDAPNRGPAVSAPNRPDATEWLSLAALLALSFVVYRMLSRARMPWMDELFSDYQVLHTSVGAFLHGLTSTVSMAPPLFASLVYGLSALTGNTMGLGRLLNWLSLAGILALMWMELRRYVNGRNAAACLMMTLLTSDEVLFHVAENRFYMPKMLLVAAGCVLFLRRAAATGAPSRTWWWSNALTHALALNVAYTAIPYMAMLVICQFVDDLLRGRLRLRVYASYLLGWCVGAVPLVLLVMNFRSATGLTPVFMERPNLGALLTSYGEGQPVGLMVAVLAGLLFVSALLRSWGSADAGDAGDVSVRTAGGPGDDVAGTLERPGLAYLGLMLALMLMPVVFWASSRTVFVVWHPRYMLPSLLGGVMLAAVIWRHLLPESCTARVPDTWRARMLTLAPSVVVMVMFGFLSFAYVQRRAHTPSHEQNWADLTDNFSILKIAKENGIATADYPLQTQDLLLFFLAQRYHGNEYPLSLCITYPLMYEQYRRFAPELPISRVQDVLEHDGRLLMVQMSREYFENASHANQEQDASQFADYLRSKNCTARIMKMRDGVVELIEYRLPDVASVLPPTSEPFEF